MQISSKEFNQRVSEIKKKSCAHPVFVTDRGVPTHVLMSIEHYKKLPGQNNKNAVEMLACDQSGDIDFEPENMKDGIFSGGF